MLQQLTAHTGFEDRFAGSDNVGEAALISVASMGGVPGE